MEQVNWSQMSTELSVDFDSLDLPTKTLLKLIEARQEVQKKLALWHSTIKRNPGLFQRLEQLDIEPRLNLNDGCIDISFTGDPDLLTKVWRELRRAGFKNDTFPTQKGDGTFCTHWHADGQARLWMFFSSNVCRRVQVGTKMVEQPVWETQCGDLPELPAQTELGELLSAEPQIEPQQEII